MTYIRDGFPGQRMHVLPHHVVAAALKAPITSRLTVTDVGYYPRAANHGRARMQGAAEAIAMVCLEGVGHLTLGGTSYRVRAGHGVVIPPRTAHAYHADETDPWTLWWLHATGTDIPDLLGPVRDRPIVEVHEPARLADQMETALRAVERGESQAALLAAAGAAWHVLATMASDALAGPKQPDGPVEQVREMLLAHFDQPWSVPELAAQVGLSSSHLGTLFRRATGGGVLDFLKRVRMARARVLLLTTDWPVAVIARLVGYGDPFYFSRQFANAHGQSPRAFRASHSDPAAVDLQHDGESRHSR